VAKAFDTVWVKGLISKVTLYNFPSYLVKTLSSYLHSRTFQTSFQSATTTCVMLSGVAQCRLLSPVLFSLYVNEIPTRSRHVELAQYAEYTAVVFTSSDPSVLVGCLEAFLGRLELWLRNWRIATNVSKTTAVLFAKAGTRVRQPRPVQFLGEPIEWVQSAPYLGVNVDSLLSWLAVVDELRKSAAQRLGVLGPLLNGRSGLSVGNGVLLYKKIIREIMDYACPIWRSAARSHFRKLQVLQSMCLRIATNAPWYVGNRHIHEDLGIPFFAVHMRVLTESFDSKLADARNPFIRQIARHLCRPRAD
jgi:hypothetical protein